MKIQNPRTGITIHCHDTGGNGRPVVLVHGLSGNYTRWAPAADILKKRYRIIDYDLRGHAVSDKGPELECGFDAHVEDLAGLMDALEIERAVIIGHSMGGMIAQNFSLKYPERVEKAVFVATAACMVPNSLARFMAVLFSRLLLILPGILMFLVEKKTSGKPRNLFPEKDKSELKPGPLALAKCMRAIIEMDLRKFVSGIKIPSLVLCSSNDELVAPAHVKELSECIPGSKFLEIENHSHYLPLEQSDHVAAAIEKFIDE